MNYLKKFGFCFLYTIISIFILTLIITIFNYFEIFNEKTMSILRIIIPIVGFLIGGFLIGKKSNKSGYIEGLKYGIIVSLIILSSNIFIIKNNFKISYLLFYLILIVSSILGSMIGINKKNND